MVPREKAMECAMLLLAIGMVVSVASIEVTHPRLDELGMSITYEIGVALLSVHPRRSAREGTG